MTGFTRGQVGENPPNLSNTPWLTISKCSHLWEGPRDSSSQQAWQIGETIDKGLFYTQRDESATLGPAPQHLPSLYLTIPNKIPFVLSPLLPLLLGKAPNNHLQSDFIVCLQSLPNCHANKQLVITSIAVFLREVRGPMCSSSPYTPPPDCSCYLLSRAYLGSSLKTGPFCLVSMHSPIRWTTTKTLRPRKASNNFLENAPVTSDL